MKYLIFIILFFQYHLDDNCQKAIKIYEEASKYQGWRVSQEAFDEAIELCPSYSDAYMQKAIPYLKRGKFIEWKVLIDKAVELNPKEHLGYRGYCRFQWLRDYQGAIKDIERLKELLGSNEMGSSVDGDYDLEIIRGLCYKMIGEKEKAIKIIEKRIAQGNYAPFLFDHLHLGVIYYELNNYDKALECFNKQIEIHGSLAETSYYRALCYKKKGDDVKFINLLKKAKINISTVIGY